MNARMQPHGSIATTEDLVQAFEDLTLDPAQFTHSRHLELAWRYLQTYGFPDGAVRFGERLRTYVHHVGAAQKHHETITWAYLVLLNEERVLRSPPGESFEQMAARRPDLFDHRNGALAAVYDKQQLERAEARRVFVLPRGCATLAKGS
jgi:hypothetical protein